MARTHREIVDKLLLVFNEQPGRFTAFYDKIYLLLTELQEGQSIVVDAICSNASRELFLDIVELCIIEERYHKHINDGVLDMTDDQNVIRRSYSSKHFKRGNSRR